MIRDSLHIIQLFFCKLIQLIFRIHKLILILRFFLLWLSLFTLLSRSLIFRIKLFSNNSSSSLVKLLNPYILSSFCSLLPSYFFLLQRENIFKLIQISSLLSLKFLSYEFLQFFIFFLKPIRLESLIRYLIKPFWLVIYLLLYKFHRPIQHGWALVNLILLQVQRVAFRVKRDRI